ncbi:hypothetical protein BGZ83_000714 [Gryganskiella cystojenkinii]|nr:hypothetical protein BGZ83_000714 [Gryganskiella cystojenkinii]
MGLKSEGSLDENDNHSRDRRTRRQDPAIYDRDDGQEEIFYPEGGYGWIVLAATFVNAFWCLGVPFCWGVFQEYFLRMETFLGADAKKLSWVGSLSCACIFAAAPAIVIITSKIGTRAVLALGIASVTTGFVVGSFSTQYWHLYLTIGVLYGVGCCINYFTAITILAQYFNQRRGVVLGIAISGSGIGATVMAPLLRWMLVQVGFRWSMRIMGGTMFVCLGCASCFIRPYKRIVVVPYSDMPLVLTSSHPSLAAAIATTATTSITANELSALASVQPRIDNPAAPSLDFRLFKSALFSLIFLGTNLFALVYLVPLLLAPSFATSIGLSAAQGATMISITSAVGIVSRILIGHLADRYGVLNLTLICCSVTGLASLILWMNAADFAALAAFMVLYGCFAGSSIVLFPVAATRAVTEFTSLTAQEGPGAVDPRSAAQTAARGVSSSLGFVFFAHAIGYLFGTPLAQFLIEDQGGRYKGAIIFVGVSNLVCAMIVLAARISVSKQLLVAV